MGEAARNEKLKPVLRGKFNGDMLSERRRTLSDIYGNIKNPAADNTDHLRLTERSRLPMKPAHNTLHRKRFVILNKTGGYPRVKITPTVIRFAEIAPPVAPYFRLDDFNTGYLHVEDIHIIGYYTKTSVIVASAFFRNIKAASQIFALPRFRLVQASPDIKLFSSANGSTSESGIPRI